MNPFVDLPPTELQRHCYWLLENKPMATLAPREAAIFLSCTVMPGCTVHMIHRWAQCRKKGMRLLNAVSLEDGKKANKTRPRYRVGDLERQAAMRATRTLV